MQFICCVHRQRMQTAPPGTYSGAIHCTTGILRHEGPLAFYKVCRTEHCPGLHGFEFTNSGHSREHSRRCLVLVFASPFNLELWKLRNDSSKGKMQPVEAVDQARNSLALSS